jgi:hypothetical protein
MKAGRSQVGSRSWLPVVEKRWSSVVLVIKISMQDAHCNKNDLAHGQDHPDDAGKPGAEKSARRVWGEAFGKGLSRSTSLGAYPTLSACSSWLWRSADHIRRSEIFFGQQKPGSIFTIESGHMRVWAISQPISLPKSTTSRLSRIWPCFSIEYFRYLTRLNSYHAST